MKRISIVGAALSANKGAAAMLETVVSRLPSYVGECEFFILTTYPDTDSSKIPHGAHARVVGLQPIRLAMVEIPIALIAYVVRKLRLPLNWVRAKASRAILDSDVVVDVAGISFVDGRGIPITVYNALMTGLALLLGVPVVKAAQALGPFHTQPNRFLASWVLPRLAAICARGAKTRSHLDEFGWSNVVDVADLAFSLEESASLPELLEQQIKALNNKYIVVMPSAVVRGLFESDGGNYVQAMCALVGQIREETRLAVVIAPHSYRVGMPEGRMNDGPVCREIGSHFDADDQVLTVDADLSAGELRRLIASCELLVTSRFHAMISGLATETPTLVLGWSHKYREVLDDFGLSDFGMDSAALSDPSSIMTKVQDAISRRGELADQIHRSLPAVRERSEKNFVVIADLLATRK